MAGQQDNPIGRGGLGLRSVVIAGGITVLTACSGSGPAADYGIAQRTEVAPLPFPTGLPSPIPVDFDVAFPGLLFDAPVALTAPPDGTDRIAVVEQRGRIRVFANDANVTAAAVSDYLDIQSQVRYGGEEGLLGLTFHPDYATNGWFYVYYTADAPRRSVLSRFTVSSGDPNAADPGSEVVLLEVAQPFGNHNSGALAFGPDGKLYVACGDGGAGDDPHDNGQNLTTLLGNILRLNDDGSVPADNPFVGGSNGERPEIWAYGLRNPWRMSFDRDTGRLWVGDVGQGAREEIDIIVRGGNYGWRVFEGRRENINPDNLSAASFIDPVHDYGRESGSSVTGGYVYRGTAVPTLAGAYVYADFGSGRVWALVYDGTQAVSNVHIATVTQPSSFGEDQAGELYVCCFDGRIRKLQPDATPPVVTEIPTMLSATGLFDDVVALDPAPGVLEYDVNAAFWSDGAEKRRWLALPGSARMAFDATGAWQFPVGTVLVKHFEIAPTPLPLSRLRLETRVMLHQESGWVGYTYRWNAAGTDADLVADAGDSMTFTVTDAGGATRQQTWQFPSRASCLSCHTAAAGHVLGVRTRQINRDFAFPLRTDNQLRTWNHLGLFTSSLESAASYPVFVDPHDSAAELDDRARAWLDVNCAQCHRPGGPTPVDLDLTIDVAESAMNLFGVSATVPVPGNVGMRAVAGSAATSDLWLRIMRRDGYGMPPLGSTEIDQGGVELLRAFLDSR